MIGIDIPSARDALDPRATMRQLNGTALAFDIAAPEAPAQIAAALDDQGIDIIVHNAGITKDKTIAKMTAAMWQSVIDINLCAQERIDDALARGRHSARRRPHRRRVVDQRHRGQSRADQLRDVESGRDRPRAKHGAVAARAASRSTRSRRASSKRR